jgi:hypothetical protein
VSGGQIRKLAADGFIEAKRILNLTSGMGTGKTPLAIAVGVIRSPRQKGASSIWSIPRRSTHP